jgi:hypothetical protein
LCQLLDDIFLALADFVKIQRQESSKEEEDNFTTRVRQLKRDCQEEAEDFQTNFAPAFKGGVPPVVHELKTLKSEVVKF